MVGEELDRTWLRARQRRGVGVLGHRGSTFGSEVFRLEGAGLEDGGMPLFEIVFNAVGPREGTGIGAKPFHMVIFDVVFELAEFGALGCRKGRVGVDIVDLPIEVFNVLSDQEEVWVDMWGVIVVVLVYGGIIVDPRLVEVRWEGVLL